MSQDEPQIRQGAIFRLKLEDPGHPHPHVVVQDDALNWSRITTTVVCAITSNLKLGSEPGNVLLEPGEGSLERPSVIVVSRLSAVPKSELTDYMGRLSTERIEQVFAGLRQIQASYFHRT